ncbi:hypothetical protein [Phocaeicola salanitronis]|uniref:hypothetical protein n=1 Tax=Phocaeicola salanitronis TaxID=376805 RepID=UPI0023F9F5E4|nr:hypothetical protein [Phocaeicola salanitronis]
MKTNVLLNMDSLLSFIHSLSLSASNKRWLAEKLLEETREEAVTKEMLDKHFGKWKDNRSADKIIEDMQNARSEIRQPLNMD